MSLVFFDTSVLIYADDTSSPEKQELAIALFSEHLRRGTAVVSLQVLQEYFVAATRKLRLAPELAQRKVEIMARSKVIRFDPSDIVEAIEFHRLKQVLFWHALIVHATPSSGAVVLLANIFRQALCSVGCVWSTHLPREPTADFAGKSGPSTFTSTNPKVN